MVISLPRRRRGLSVVKSRYSFKCIPKCDLNFEFGGQTTETGASVQEENEPVKERTRFIALEKQELNEAWKMLIH